MPKRQQARHHHYLPQCYLRGFTRSGGKKSKITVIDLRQRNYFETITRNIGGIRDFNRIEVPGISPDILETQISSFEGAVAESIKALEVSLDFSGKKKEYIINLIALLAIRTPQMRENWNNFHGQIAKRIMDLALATKERWQSQIARMEQEGV